MNYFYILNQYFLRVAFSTYFNTRVFGRENVPVKGPVLLISNHQSFLDPMLCGFGLNRELDYMARDSLFNNKFFGAYIRGVNTFPVQRDHADIKAIRLIINRLKAGRAVTMFPEGTRSRSGQLKPFKKGAFKMAQDLQLPVLPVTLTGTFEILPPGTARLRPGQHAQITLHPAISPLGHSEAELVRLMHQSHTAIAAPLGEACPQPG